MKKTKFNIYKLKNGKKEGGWQLPLSDVLVERIKDGESIGLRKIKFAPGSKTIWAEDINGDLKVESIWFDKGMCIVPKVDLLKNEILQKHPWFNVHYELFDKEIESKKELESLRFKGEARKLIDEADSDDILAMAISVFGIPAINWDESTAELELRKLAENDPLKLKREFGRKDYQSKHLSAMAFSKGIVKTNLGKTAVVWDDSTEGVIIRLAQGENGLVKLGEFLHTQTENSENVLQAIGERLDKLNVSLPSKKEDKVDAKADKDLSDENELLKLQIEYMMEYNNPVPLNMRKNKEWIKEKIEEKKNSDQKN